MGSKPSSNFEESTHYGGEATVRFYPGAHYYAITDDKMKLKNKRAGGATSLTGVMGKGPGLMLYPMYEMKKYLKNYFRSTTIEEMFDSPMSLDDLLKEGTQAHVKKSDRGKSVGTDAHAWVESYLIEALRVQEKLGITSMEELLAKKADYDAEFKCPEIPSVEELGIRLRQSYIEIFKASKPKSIDEYRKLTKALFADSEIQEALHIEATMLNLATSAAKGWFDIHDVFVHGTEDTVYSRKMQICGKYDADLSVRCGNRCNWCYLNGDEEKIINVLNELGEDHTFTGRYITDYKSTNASSSAPKGVYPEYLAQCGIYDLAKTEEFPEIHYDGHLILNGSKNEPERDANGNPVSRIPGKPYSPFNTHFSFERERNREWGLLLSQLKEIMYQAEKEVKQSA